MQYEIYQSPMGPLWLMGENGVLTALSFADECEGMTEVSGAYVPVKQWLDAYFRGEPIPPDFPIKPSGTPFQQLIWQLLLDIPFGCTKTYGELARAAARMMGKGRMSSQAVGQAVSRNPINIIIPCHRIIGAGGTLTGYRSGLHRKQWLLVHEGILQEETL